MKNKIMLSLASSLILQSSVFGVDTLKDVVVIAKSNQSIENTAGSISIISAKEIKNSNATSIQDVLKNVTGLSLGINDSSINGRQNISVRGMGSKHTLILINGQRISGTDAQIGHSDFQYNSVPINSIEKIEIIKGNMSSLYGSNALGGVVNIITKKSDKKIYGNIDLQAGSSADDGGNTEDISINLGGKINEKLSMSIGVEKKKLTLANKGDAIDTDGTSYTRQIEGKDIQNILLGLDYNIDDSQSIGLLGSKGKEERHTTDYDEFYKINKEFKSINYTKIFDDITLDLNYYTNKSDSHTKQFTSNGSNFTHYLEDSVFNAEVQIDTFDSNYIVTGIEKRIEKYHKKYDTKAKDATNGFQDEIEYKSMFIQDEIEISDTTILTIGARYDKHERFGSEISPKINAVYKLSPYSRLKAGYGEGFNAPTLTQNSDEYTVSVPVKTTFPLEFNRFTGNNDLKPELSKNYELGYEYQKDTKSFKSTLFYSRVTDMIEAKNIGTTAGFPISYVNYEYSNIDEAISKGLELEFSHTQIIPDLDLKLGYTYLKTKNKDTGKELNNKPKHNINLNLAANLPKNIKSNLNIHYIGSQMTAHDNGTPLDSTDDYAFRFSGYTLVNLQLSKEIVKNLTVRVGIDNIFNKDLEGAPSPYEIKSRLAYVGLNYKF